MTSQRIPKRIGITLAATALFAALIACSLFSSSPSKGDLAASPAAPQNSTSATQPSVERPSAGATVTVEGLTLSDPWTGFADLKSVHIHYSSSLDGKSQDQDTQSSLEIEAWKNGADESARVHQTGSDSAPISLALAMIGGEKYSQQKEGGICQAALSTDALIASLGIKLPPVFGAKEAGQETVNEIPTTHYTFDEKAVAWQAGKDGKAQGEVWIAAEGGYVVKYTLSIQVSSQEFTGTRSWTYELSEVGAETPVALPEGCLPMLNDILVMGHAINVIQRPGFQKYTVQAALTAVSQFYAEMLGQAGWSLMPAEDPEGGKVTLKYVQDKPASGGRFVAIDIEEASGVCTVIVQSAQTKNAIKMDPTPEPGAVPPAGTPTEVPSEGGETPEASSGLPADLPSYPGASVMSKTDGVVMLTTSDSAEKVSAFYKTEMAKLGYTASDTMNAGGMDIVTWEKDGLSLQIIIMGQGGKTMITVTTN